MSGEVKKVNLKSKNITEETLEELKRLVPSAFKEGKIDFEALKSVLGDMVEHSREFYNFTWAGKSEAFRTLQRPSTATLKPCIEESKEWNATENLFIEGDNLEVLKLLQKTYHNSIKMIYIDPPYNKDKDFVYPDRWSEGIKSYKEFCGFVDSEGNITTSEDEAKNAAGRKHSRWLTMMYPRLFLARNLLKDDGVIFVSIDDDEAANLKKMMDEIFGEENFYCTFIWQKRSGSMDSSDGVSQDHEYVLCYGKNKTALKGILRTFDKYENPDDDPRGPWIADNLSAGKAGGDVHYEITDPETGNTFFPPKGRYWPYSPSTMLQKIIEKRVIFPKNKDGRPMLKRFQYEAKSDYLPVSSILRNYTDKNLPNNALIAALNTKGTSEVESLFADRVFYFPKSIVLIQSLMSQIVLHDKNDIIIDFFAGSGTTAHAVMALNAEDGGNRKFICVQIPEPTPENSEAKKAGYKTIAEISKERIRRAGELVRHSRENGNPSLLDPRVKHEDDTNRLDIGFKVFKLDESNFKQWDKEVADVETLKQQIIDFADNVAHGADKTDMLYELLLKKGYNLNAKVESRQIADNEIFVVDDSMFVCLDESISIATIDEIINLRPAHFIVLDKAFLGADQLKTNTWQTFKSLFPNDENPFETV